VGVTVVLREDAELVDPFRNFPPYTIGLIAGIASGAGMLPYTVIKEANPPNMALAIIFTLLLKETGPAVRTTATHQEKTYEPKNGHGKIRRATS
jgi:hypothetical protein